VLATASVIPHRDRASHDISFVICAKDLTEIKGLQQRIVQNSRLADLGDMAARVAHEINNPLAIVKGSTAMTLKW